MPADLFAPTGHALGLSRWPRPCGRRGRGRAALFRLQATQSRGVPSRRESDRLALPGVQQPRESTDSDRVASPADSGQRLSQPRPLGDLEGHQARDLLYLKKKSCVKMKLPAMINDLCLRPASFSTPLHKHGF